MIHQKSVIEEFLGLFFQVFRACQIHVLSVATRERVSIGGTNLPATLYNLKRSAFAHGDVTVPYHSLIGQGAEFRACFLAFWISRTSGKGADEFLGERDTIRLAGGEEAPKKLIIRPCGKRERRIAMIRDGQAPYSSEE